MEQDGRVPNKVSAAVFMENTTTGTGTVPYTEADGMTTVTETEISAGDGGDGGPLSDTAYTAIGVYLTIACSISLLGNTVLGLTMLQKGTWRHSSFNLFLLNIILACLIESFCCYPLVIASNFKGRWLFSELGCVYYAFTAYTCGMVVMTCYLLVSVHRYRVIVLRVPADSPSTYFWIRCSLVGAWTYSLCWSVCPFLGFGCYTLEPFATSCSLGWVDTTTTAKMYNALAFVFLFYFPVGIMSWCYIMVMKKLNSQVGAVNQCDNTVNSNTTTNTTSQSGGLQTQSLKIIFTTLVTFMVIWTPYSLLSMLANFNVHIYPSISVLPTLMAKTHAAINPIVYFISYHHYRLPLYQLFGAAEQA